MGKSPTNEGLPLPCLIAEGMPFAETPPFSGLFFRFQRCSACFAWAPSTSRAQASAPARGIWSQVTAALIQKNQSLPEIQLANACKASGSAGGAAVSCTEELEMHRCFNDNNTLNSY